MQALVCVAAAVFCAAVGAEDSNWRLAHIVAGVSVEARASDDGFDRHRAQVKVCTGIGQITRFVADAGRYAEWVEAAEEVELLEREPQRIVFYLRTGAPWPFRARDMIYELTLQSGDSNEALHFTMAGLADYLPLRSDAVRMERVSGDWWLTVEDGGVRVQLELYAHPGSVPRYFANRRAANMLGLTLANLARRFPCVVAPAQ